MSARSSKRKITNKVKGSGVKVPFLDLSDDEIVRVLSLLWYQDLFRVISLSNRLRSLVEGNNTLVKYLITNQIERNEWKGFQPDRFCKSMSSGDILVLASRMPLWPTDIDTTDLRYDLATEDVDARTSSCVSYAGAVLGKNRSFVANYHFPVFDGRPQEGGLETVSSFPFTKPVFDTTLQSTIPVLSGISYFEITIHKAVRQVSTTEQTAPFTPCVAIGLANHRHRLNKMPGWDSNSFGFHGDDGCFFRRYADEGIQISEEARFGEGDTVGLGIIYSQLKDHLNDTGPATPNELFLTVNGKYVCRYLFSASSFAQCTWFPCVGTDCHCPIEMNFGSKGVPFAFDVVQFERDELKPPPVPPASKRKSKGKKKAVVPAAPAPVVGVAAPSSLLFRAPYHPHNTLAGGLYRDKEFRSRVTEHVLGNASCDYDSIISDNDSIVETFGEGDEGEEGEDDEDVGESGDESGTGSDSSEGSGESGEFDEFEGNESSDADSIASESSSSLMVEDELNCWFG